MKIDLVLQRLHFQLQVFDDELQLLALGGDRVDKLGLPLQLFLLVLEL